jgi:hypothetical protein
VPVSVAAVMVRPSTGHRSRHSAGHHGSGRCCGVANDRTGQSEQGRSCAPGRQVDGAHIAARGPPLLMMSRQHRTMARASAVR